MTPTSRLRNEIEKIGYSAIIDNYSFSDVFAPDNVRRTVPVAAFTHTPASYRSAAIGIVKNEGKGAEVAVREHRALGAPLLFVIDGQEVTVWQVYAGGPPRLLERTRWDDLAHLFAKKRPLWSPDTIHRAKLIGRVEPTSQLDFVDVGLMPAIEGQIHNKLDHLLSDALAATPAISSQGITQDVFQGVFRLLAAKVLQDRGHELSLRWDTENASSVMTVIASYYGLQTSFDTIALGKQLQNAWETLSNGISVANVSADDLAFLYENTLVTPATRRQFGTHSTPRHVAEYIVSRLDLWRDGTNLPSIFEPFAGAGVFLVSALRHMGEALPLEWSDAQRHNLLVQKLSGSEVDSFASEVATLSLILADYPNRNGWQIETTDLFHNNMLRQRLARADVILCNPPFEAFSAQQRAQYPEMAQISGAKAEAVLMLALQVRPQALGFVLPRTFLMDRAYREHRRQVEAQFKEIELVSLPDGVFAVSQMETALLIAHDRVEAPGSQILRSSEVYDRDRQAFRLMGRPSRVREECRGAPVHPDGRLWIPPLGPLWRRLSGSRQLGEFFEGHWGIRWIEKRQKSAASDHPGQDRAFGLLSVRDHRQFALGRPRWLDVAPEHLYGGGQLPWHTPKILCNAIRLSRRSWRLAAAVDLNGLVASQQYVALWTRADVTGIDLDAYAAILNGPLANAFLTDHSADRRLRISTLLSLPIPAEMSPGFGELVKEYRREIELRDRELGSDKRLSELLDAIDAFVLDAYDLPPRLVRTLLASFRNQQRPVVHEWEPWAVFETDPALTLSELRGGRLEQARGDWIKRKLLPVPKSEAEQAIGYLP